MKSKLLLCLTLIFSGCVAHLPQPEDIRTAMLESAGKTEPDFPDGHAALLTHFSHIGQLITLRGDIIYVADQRGVIAGQMSPHGLNYIVFFDAHFRYLGKINYVSSRPLWCEGSKLYLFGDLDSRLPQFPQGNVIDVTDGFTNLKVYHAKVYGSSGGLHDP
jgi:hypothetical protein